MTKDAGVCTYEDGSVKMFVDGTELDLDSIDNPEFQRLRAEKKQLMKEYNLVLETFQAHRASKPALEVLKDGDFHKLATISGAYLRRMEEVGEAARAILRDECMRLVLGIDEEAQQAVAAHEERAERARERLKKVGAVAKVVTGAAAVVAIFLGIAKR